jgi:PBSX family phage terminase large subunit
MLIMENEFRKTQDQIQAIQLLGGSSRHILLFGGSRSGKTFILIYALVLRALKAAGSRHAILRFRFNSAKQAIWLDTLPKVLKICFPGIRLRENRTDWFLQFANGSEIWLCGLDDDARVEKILGKEFATVYFNECSEISYHAVTIALSRLAQKTRLTNRAYYDCNPVGKSHWSYRLFVEKIDPETNTALFMPGIYDSMVMNPSGNRDNLPDGYIEETLAGLPERKRRRFLLGEWMNDLEGALWNSDMINKHRVVNTPELSRVVIGVDPAVTANATSDATGIVVAGRGSDGDYYILDDASCEKASPYEWAKEVINKYRQYHADRVIGEVNNGGDLIEMNLRNVDRTISFRAVRATRGKFTRAEPVAALYEQGKVHHIGVFQKLEDEMCSYNPATAASSPDRMDALVWAVTELSRSSRAGRIVLA